jgi:hypothetical protein
VPALLFIFALLLALTGCVDEETFKADVELGKSLVEALQARRLDSIDARFDRAAVGSGSRAALAKMAALLPADAPTSIEVAGVHTLSWAGKGVRRVALSLQYRFGDKWFLVSAQWRRPDAGGSPIVESLHVAPLRASLQEINRFTLEEKSPIHYTVFALAVALPLFTLAVLVRCLRTPMSRWRKVFWLVAILVGLTTFSLDWTSGAMLWRPLHAQLASASFTKTDLGPVILSISVPLGAIVFLFRPRPRRRSPRRPVTPPGVRRATG